MAEYEQVPQWLYKKGPQWLPTGMGFNRTVAELLPELSTLTGGNKEFDGGALEQKIAHGKRKLEVGPDGRKTRQATPRLRVGNQSDVR
jgi:hypothetical protein